MFLCLKETLPFITVPTRVVKETSYKASPGLGGIDLAIKVSKKASRKLNVHGDGPALSVLKGV